MYLIKFLELIRKKQRRRKMCNIIEVDVIVSGKGKLKMLQNLVEVSQIFAAEKSEGYIDSEGELLYHFKSTELSTIILRDNSSITVHNTYDEIKEKIRIAIKKNK
jgi:hypothetical protein